MHSSERTVQHGPTATVLSAAFAVIVLATGFADSAWAQSVSLQDRLRLFKAKKQGTQSTSPPPAANPYSNYRSQLPSTSEWNQSRPTNLDTDPSGFQPIRNSISPPRTPEFGEPYHPDDMSAGSRMTPQSAPRESQTPVEPIGGWRANYRSSNGSGQAVGYEIPTTTPRPDPGTIYQPTDNPEQFVAQPPLSRPGEVPDVTQPNTAASQMLLPQTTDPYEGMSRWQRLKMRLAAGRPMTVQNTFTTLTWLFSDPNDVGMFDIYTQATFLVPSAPGFSFTPSFQVYFPDGPTQTDLPGQLYGIRGEFRQLLPLHERLAADLAISPGVYSDFQQSGSGNFRLQGRALFSYLWSEHSQLLFGFLYLDRFDVNVLPAGGWIYTPTDDVRVELVFPRPKFAYRTSHNKEYSRWIYLAGEFGGDVWAVQRASGPSDNLAYRDLRLIFGFEQKYANGRSLLFEAGYVFGRKVIYDSNVGDFDPSSTGMLRAGLVY